WLRWGSTAGSLASKTSYDHQAGREGIQLEIDRNKIKPDIGKVREKIGGGDTQAEEKPEEQHAQSAAAHPRGAADGVPRDRPARPLSPGLLGLAHGPAHSGITLERPTQERRPWQLPQEPRCPHRLSESIPAR